MRHLLLVVAALLLPLASCGDDDAAPPVVQVDAAVPPPPECDDQFDCNDENDCTYDSCGGDGKCVFLADAELESMPCEDGDLCTEGTCKAGVCDSVAKDCSGAGNGCNDGVCDAQSGNCVAAPREDGLTCDDGLFCTTTDTCQAGVCTGGEDRACPAADACNPGVCDEATAACTTAPAGNGAACDDGLFCTTGDTCNAGQCGGGARDCAAAGDSCNTGVCNESAGECVKMPANQGATCNDGLFCTTADTCNAGQCGGGARDCSAASDSCNTGICSEGADQCVKMPANPGATCDDGLFCTQNDACQAGVCGGGARDCTAFGDACNSGSCNETSNACVKAPANENATCNDGLFCSAGDRCVAGSCTPTGPKSCADTMTCTTDTCNEGTDTCDNTNTPVPGAEGPPGSPTCADGLDNDCDGSADGSDANCAGCQGPTDCNDGNPCTADTCNAGTCVNAPSSGATCDDGKFCTQNDVCSAGVCGGAARDCSAAGDTCNNGACNETTDQCVKSPKPNTTTCSDNLFCTVNDVCTNGTCGGANRDCTAVGDACNSGICSEGADQCVKTPANPGAACSDGLFCTQNDVCNAGACTGGARDCSAVADACNGGTCAESTDTCVKAPVGNGTACNTLFCATGETCQAGNCQGGTPVTCSDGDACTIDTCNEATDVCGNNPRTVDTASAVLSSSSDGSPLTACLAAGSGGKVLVWTELRDSAGVSITGATVTIGGVAATASTSEPGTYYREVTAPVAAGTTSLSVNVVACGQSVTLATSVSLTTVAANAGTGGLGGCTPADGNLRIKVIAAETGAPVVGARVLIGQAEGTPFQKGPEGVFGGPLTAATNVATSDASGFASFLDYGATLAGVVTVTAGAEQRAYMTVVGVNASDLVMPLPLSNPPLPAKATYTGDGPAAFDGACDVFDAAFVLPQLSLDFFTTFEVKSLFERSRCWNSGTDLVGTVSIPGNLWIPSQGVGLFGLCLATLTKAPWTLSLPIGQTLNLETGQVTVPVADVQAVISGGGSFTDLLTKVTWRKLGWLIGEIVSGNKTLNTTATSNHAMAATIAFAGQPAETDVVGILGADYSGANGTGALFLVASQVRPFNGTGQTVAVANNPFTGNTGARRFASLAALYLDDAGHPNVPANRIKGISSVLLRGTIPAGNVSLTASGMLGIAGTTVTQPNLFTWQNATANGNAPLFSLHELTIRETKYLPVLSCQTKNDAAEAFFTQWIVIRAFAATCSGQECFTLPTLPASFPRAASSAGKRSGFDARPGSGAACGTGLPACGSGESCVDPDGANPAAGSMCLTGAGSEASPYTARDYFWKLHVYDLDLPAFNFQTFQFADRKTYVTHESSNGQSFQ